ncbi:DUF378 domain-containing protein [Massilia sp. R2A-15]|uniref:DUF378 domain-containing protein n=1 Tax=Massilia sp. R2A-15 TaxID=3064278 RepID=UPI0027355412|nr:DUF378 domain-containing protein [Massilia sp. R2A-15]WLI91554.1 DUF378 domain-containing protein [Massilia sp. R2A-15]
MATLDMPTTDRRHIPERRHALPAERYGWKVSAIDYIALALLVIGGLNWACVALFNVDAVATLFGAQSPATRLIYSLVGIAALYTVYFAARMARRPH